MKADRIYEENQELRSQLTEKDNTAEASNAKLPDQLINHMLQSYSEVLAKIHTSVRSLGTRLEDIE
jgi:predicted nuclease with TOPRIM domain